MFEPTALGSTTLHLRTFGVEFAKGTAAGAKTMEHIHTDSHAFTRKVFNEDAGICRKVQAGLECATRLAVSAKALEDRVRHLQKTY